MAKYKVIKYISFGAYSIKDKDGYDTQLQNYAPKIGDIIEGSVTSGHLLGVPVVGIPFEIKTNGVNSTAGQTSLQTIPLDYLELDTNGTGNSGNGNGNNPINNANTVGPDKYKTAKIIGLIAVVVVVVVLIVVAIKNIK